MKHSFINYAKSIHFKIMNDRMTFREAMSFLLVVLIISYLIIRIVNPELTVIY